MNAFLQTLRNLGPVRLAAMGGVALLLLGFFIYVMTRLSSQDMGLLYSDLELADSGEIAAQLDGMNVAYELRNSGATIMVPAGQVDRLRLAMAQQGLPTGGSLGYELFDQSDGFGTTNFMQNVNRLRALEGELARTVGTIANVRQARVHLVLPERELFSREQQAPSASVFLRLDRGGLTPEQTLAIQHLVAAAVPRLEPRAISIVDDRGTLLARGPGADEDELRLMNAEELRRRYERRLTDTLEELLSRSVGFGKVRAQVNLDMDFDRVTTSMESYDPDSQVARSTQFVEEEAESNEGEGVDPVGVAGNLPEAPDAGPLGGPTSTSRTNRTEETVNYEINRTVRNVVRESGVVRRMTVAVLVDGTYEPGADGEMVYAARSDADLAQIDALARTAVGFDASRGDTIEVVNMRFVSPDEGMFDDAPSTFLGMRTDDLLDIAQILVLGVVAALVILLVVRPLLNRAMDTEQPQTGPMDELDRLLPNHTGMPRAALAGPAALPEIGPPDNSDEIDALIDINQVEGRVRASSLKKVGEIVEKHPEEAVSIIRNWLYQET